MLVSWQTRWCFIFSEGFVVSQDVPKISDANLALLKWIQTNKSIRAYKGKSPEHDCVYEACVVLEKNGWLFRFIEDGPLVVFVYSPKKCESCGGDIPCPG